MNPLSAVRRRTAVLRDAVKSQLWPAPTIGVVLAVALGVLLPQLDGRVDGDLSDTLSRYLFGGGPDAARNVLNAVTSSLITVTSLTFSLTVVTLQLASSQFSPRLLRTFARDRFVHLTLALFLSTFTYSLVVLRTVRTATDQRPQFVPQLSVTVAVLLTLASVIGLVLFLAHLASQIRVETMLENVHDDASATLRGVLRDRPDDVRSLEVPPTPPPYARPVMTARTGFLVSVQEAELLEAARDTGAVLLIEGFPGGSLVAGTPFGKAWSVDGAALDDDAQTELSSLVADAVSAGRERTTAQDIAYGLRQMTDVAIKALSPGINDPTTCVHALGHIAGLLCEMVRFELGPRLLRDDEGRVRVVLARPDLGDLLDSAIAQPRRYGRQAPNVLMRLLELLREVGWCVRDDDQRDAVRQQLQRMRETVGAAELSSTWAAVQVCHRRMRHQRPRRASCTWLALCSSASVSTLPKVAPQV